jgi:hypothetical protein
MQNSNGLCWGFALRNGPPVSFLPTGKDAKKEKITINFDGVRVYLSYQNIEQQFACRKVNARTGRQKNDYIHSN